MELITEEHTATVDTMTILQLVRALAVKVEVPDDAEAYEKLSTDDIESVSALLPSITAAVNRALNSRRKINTLPNEILVKVFSFVPQLPCPEFTSNLQRSICGTLELKSVWELLSIPQVCHKWREVSLDISALWSSAFFSNGRREFPVPICLLSRCHPEQAVQIFLEEGSDDHSLRTISDNRWEVLQEYRSRVNEFHCRIPVMWSDDTVPHSLSVDLPNLQRLLIHGRPSSNPMWKGLIPLLGDEILPLRFLALEDAPFLPVNRIFPHLTCLVLSYTSVMVPCLQTAWNLDDLLFFLSNTPQVEEVFLNGIPLHVVSAPGSRMVTIQRLRKLSINADMVFVGQPPSCRYLLSHLILPDNCYICAGVNTSLDIDHVIPHLARYQLTTAEPRMHLSCDFTRISLQITSSFFGGVRIDRPTYGIGSGISDDMKESLRVLIKSPSFLTTRTLWVSGPVIDSNLEADSEHLQAFLSMPNIEELYIHHYGWTTPRTFLDSLRPFASLAANPPRVPYPRLNKLFVHIYDRDDLDQIAQILSARSEAGCPVRRFIAGADLDEPPRYEKDMQHPKEEIEAAVGRFVEDLVIITEDEYHRHYSVRRSLPDIVTVIGPWIGMPMLWPPWVEDERRRT